jgi:hypothetical protein
MNRANLQFLMCALLFLSPTLRCKGSETKNECLNFGKISLISSGSCNTPII